jgi:hypothetical protein
MIFGKPQPSALQQSACFQPLVQNALTIFGEEFSANSARRIQSAGWSSENDGATGRIFDMANEWIIDVLADLRQYAQRHQYMALAEQLDDAIVVAAGELMIEADAADPQRVGARSMDGPLISAVSSRAPGRLVSVT